jgi:hypothetical protein
MQFPGQCATDLDSVSGGIQDLQLVVYGMVNCTVPLTIGSGPWGWIIIVMLELLQQH